MCNDWCDTHYGTQYGSNQICEMSSGAIRGGVGTVYPNRSSSYCAGGGLSNPCWEHNACNCYCNEQDCVTYEMVNGPFVGCTDEGACNYDSEALCQLEDDECDYSCYGCTDEGATNYCSGCTVDDGSCQYYEAECVDPTALNCDPLCEQCEQGGLYICESAGDCQYPIIGCTDTFAVNFDSYATEACDGVGEFDECIDNFGVPFSGYNCCCDYGDNEEDKPILGCIDPDALNYDSEANTDDGSCLYPGDEYHCTGSFSCLSYWEINDECPSHWGCESVGIPGQPHDCEWYGNPNNNHCEQWGHDEGTSNYGMIASEACCVCGGGNIYTGTPTRVVDGNTVYELPLLNLSEVESINQFLHPHYQMTLYDSPHFLLNSGIFPGQDWAGTNIGEWTMHAFCWLKGHTEGALSAEHVEPTWDNKNDYFGTEAIDFPGVSFHTAALLYGEDCPSTGLDQYGFEEYPTSYAGSDFNGNGYCADTTKPSWWEFDTSSGSVYTQCGVDGSDPTPGTDCMHIYTSMCVKCVDLCISPVYSYKYLIWPLTKSASRVHS